MLGSKHLPPSRQVKSPTITIFDTLPWRTPVDVSFIVATHAAKAKEAAMHLFVLIVLRHVHGILTSRFRKTGKRAHSALAQTANDGRKNAHLTGSPRSARTRKVVTDEHNLRPRAHRRKAISILLQALMAKSLTRYCALHSGILPISGGCSPPPKPQITHPRHPLHTRKMAFSRDYKVPMQVVASLNYFLATW